MNGKYILDTNAIIALLHGNMNLGSLLSEASWIGISVISELEFHCFSNLSEKDAILFEEFKSRIEVLNVNSENTSLIQSIVYIRKETKVKLPDAIIGATALHHEASLLTLDAGFAKIPNLKTLSF